MRSSCHADRAKPLRDYCQGLTLLCERKSVEPMAAATAPERTAAQHQSLLHFDQASQRQYHPGDMSGYKSTRAAMGDMAKSLQRDPQLESLLANRKRELGIGGNFGSGRRLGDELAFTHGIELGRGRSIGL